MTSANARRLARVNVALILVCSVLLAICVVRQLWIPALVNLFFIVSNGVQLVSVRRGLPPRSPR